MSKVVCYVCGSSYPEDLDQCPVCGFTQPVDSSSDEEMDEIYYTYVKGGRFSKSNVRKRNKEIQAENPAPVVDNKKKKNNGVAVFIPLLLLGILAIIAYILLRFFVPNDFIYEGTDGFGIFMNATEDTQTPADDIVVPDETAGVSVTIDTTEIVFDEVGNTYELDVIVEPADSTDIVEFNSSNTNVATVDENGVITAVDKGSAFITVTCGTASTKCHVICSAAAFEVPLNRKEIVFNGEGQSWLLYSGMAENSEIVWSSDDDSVATVNAGMVVSVAEGSTVIHATYGNQTVSCIVHCVFNDSIFINNNEITEAVGNT